MRTPSKQQLFKLNQMKCLNSNSESCWIWKTLSNECRSRFFKFSWRETYNWTPSNHRNWLVRYVRVYVQQHIDENERIRCECVCVVSSGELLVSLHTVTEQSVSVRIWWRIGHSIRHKSISLNISHSYEPFRNRFEWKFFYFSFVFCINISSFLRTISRFTGHEWNFIWWWSAICVADVVVLPCLHWFGFVHCILVQKQTFEMCIHGEFW